MFIGPVSNVSPTPDLTDLQWLQASLPVKDGGLGVRRVNLRSHFLPFWLQRQAHSPTRTISCHTVTVPTMPVFRTAYRFGPLLSAQFQTLCHQNSHSGTALALWLTET